MKHGEEAEIRREEEMYEASVKSGTDSQLGWEERDGNKEEASV